MESRGLIPVRPLCNVDDDVVDARGHVRRAQDVGQRGDDVLEVPLAIGANIKGVAIEEQAGGHHDDDREGVSLVTVNGRCIDALGC